MRRLAPAPVTSTVRSAGSIGKPRGSVLGASPADRVGDGVGDDASDGAAGVGVVAGARSDGPADGCSAAAGSRGWASARVRAVVTGARTAVIGGPAVARAGVLPERQAASASGSSSTTAMRDRLT